MTIKIIQRNEPKKQEQDGVRNHDGTVIDMYLLDMKE